MSHSQEQVIASIESTETENEETGIELNWIRDAVDFEIANGSHKLEKMLQKSTHRLGFLGKILTAQLIGYGGALNDKNLKSLASSLENIITALVYKLEKLENEN